MKRPMGISKRPPQTPLTTDQWDRFHRISKARWFDLYVQLHCASLPCGRDSGEDCINDVDHILSYAEAIP